MAIVTTLRSSAAGLVAVVTVGAIAYASLDSGGPTVWSVPVIELDESPAEAVPSIEPRSTRFWTVAPPLVDFAPAVGPADQTTGADDEDALEGFPAPTEPGEVPPTIEPSDREEEEVAPERDDAEPEREDELPNDAPGTPEVSEGEADDVESESGETDDRPEPPAPEPEVEGEAPDPPGANDDSDAKDGEDDD